MGHCNIILFGLLTAGLICGSPESFGDDNVTRLGTRRITRDTSSLKSVVASGVPIIQFCCERHHYFDVQNRTCSQNKRPPLDPIFHTKDGHLITEKTSFANVTYINTCQSYFLHNSQFYLLKTGELRLNPATEFVAKTKEVLIDAKDFCLLWVTQGEAVDMAALVCFPEEEDSEFAKFQWVVHLYVLPTIMAISALFLAATFVVYCLVAELRDLLGKCFMCSLATLFLSKVFGVITKVLSGHMPIRPCIAMGMLMHLGFLHAFFWLNVISFVLFFSIWYHGRVCGRGIRKWFGLSCCYAFGTPLLIMGVVIIHDVTSFFDNHLIPKPGFGVVSCGFADRGAQAVYFYAPIAVLLGINLFLFLASACRLFLLSKHSSIYVFQFTHYLKLLILMGIPWIFEVLSFFFAQTDQLTASAYVWLAFDIFNALQGVIIFIVFACRRAVLARVAEAVCGLNYARRKYPDVLYQPRDETQDALTQDLRMAEVDRKTPESSS